MTSSEKITPFSKEEIVLLYKKLFFSLGDRDGFYEWLCEDFCEKEPWNCDGNCPDRGLFGEGSE